MENPFLLCGSSSNPANSASVPASLHQQILKTRSSKHVQILDGTEALAKGVAGDCTPQASSQKGGLQVPEYLKLFLCPSAKRERLGNGCFSLTNTFSSNIQDAVLTVTKQHLSHQHTPRQLPASKGAFPNAHTAPAPCCSPTHHGGLVQRLRCKASRGVAISVCFSAALFISFAQCTEALSKRGCPSLSCWHDYRPEE